MAANRAWRVRAEPGVDGPHVCVRTPRECAGWLARRGASVVCFWLLLRPATLAAIGCAGGGFAL
jgi:hypothetical protein